MKRLTLILAAASLAVPAGALGKGPSAATMDGPGGGGISFAGSEGSGSLGQLAQQSGFYTAVFRQEPDPMLDRRPKGDLGPKYTITYTVPGPNNEVWRITQDVYPYAKPAPVTYMPPGQEAFATEGTRGGWFQARPELKTTLVAAGLPAGDPADGSAGDASFPTATVSVLAIALLFVGATALLVRRRARPAAA